MGLTSIQLAEAVHRLAAHIGSIERELNEADAKLGDGDTGVMLRRVLEKLDRAADALPSDLGAAFQKLAIEATAATGSSLGTLLCTALASLGTLTRGQSELPWSELGAALGVARDAMLARGKAALGDKTVLDSIDAVACAVADIQDKAEVARESLASSRRVLAEFQSKTCKIGRARMFGSRSSGLHDPGMLAFTRFVEALKTA
jgi:hypothetical protein